VIIEGHFGDLLIVVTLCALLTRDLLAMAKFFSVGECGFNFGIPSSSNQVVS